jgi:flagellar protein FliS
MTPIELAYRKTAVEGSSGFGLLIALYDTLAGDLRRAADAERANDLGKRATESKHALLVIAYLEEWIDRGSGGELADHLVVFYRTLRRKIVEAQVKRSPEMLEQQMAEVLKIRELWQGIELRDESSATKAPAWAQASVYPGQAQYERIASNWSA